ncbi:MAG TPA: hypothetical protein VF939_00780 [Puia sp.]
MQFLQGRFREAILRPRTIRKESTKLDEAFGQLEKVREQWDIPEDFH